MIRIYSALAGAVLASVVAAHVQAAVPPSTSPAGRGQHPRVFLTAAELPGLRDRLATHYRAELQAFIDLLNDTSALSSGQRAIENHWGSLNYAFLAILDPGEMQARGFSFIAALDTPQEYCARAAGYARSMLSSIAAATGQSHGDMLTGYPQSIYVPVVAAYDWCYPHLASADRTAIVDAFVSAYTKKYQGQNLLTMEISGLDMLANNQSSADIHDILGIVAFYGDPYPSPALQSEMFNAFWTIWLDRILAELNRLYASGTGWHEGSGGYLQEGLVNLGAPVAAFSSALGVDYIAGTPFFARFPIFTVANVKPQSLLAACGSSGTARCPEYMERWGTISGGIAGVGCKPALLLSGMLRRAKSETAPLAKWAATTLTGGCSSVFTQYGGSWSNAVLYQLLFGDREVTARTAAELGVPRAQRLGLGEYVLRTGYGSGDTQVVFWANEFGTYGHASQEYGHFSLHKFGNLILTAANSKSGDAVLSTAKFNALLNVVGIHKGASDATLGFNGNVTDPFFGARGITRIRTVGALRAETINHPAFDYVGYDNSAAWSPTTASVSQREFVYLKGAQNQEYLVVLDRVTVQDPGSDEKIWKIWVPAAPQFVNGTPTNPRLGKWTSTNSDTLVMTNQYTGLRTPNFESAPTRGRFFLKTLLPAAPRINVLGGDGMEFQSGNDDGTTPWGSPAMTQGMHEYLGWGRIEVVPTAARAADTFLNVIQFGEATMLTAMSPTSRIASVEGKVLGADIGDSSGSRVVLFSAAADGATVSGGVAYAFRPVSSASRHLLVNMARSATYHVGAQASSSGTTVAIGTSPSAGSVAVTTNDQGVLVFSLVGTTVTAGDVTAPAAPRNLRAQ